MKTSIHDKFTCNVMQLGAAKTPSKIKLYGDKKRQVESAQHVIEFPGGAVEVSRTIDGNYWAHIIVNRGTPIEDAEGLVSARGEIIGNRVDREYPHEGTELKNPEQITQVALLIKTARNPAHFEP